MLVIVAAVVDAIAARRLIAGIVTVLVPFAAFGLFVVATPGTIEGVELRSIIAMALILAGVAIREVWMRAGVLGGAERPAQSAGIEAGLPAVERTAVFDSGLSVTDRSTSASRNRRATSGTDCGVPRPEP